MRRNGCPTDDELAEFNLGDLSEDVLEDVARHLERCPRCEARAQRLDGQTDEILAALRRSAARSPGLEERIRKRAPAGPVPGEEPPGGTERRTEAGGSTGRSSSAGSGRSAGPADEAPIADDLRIEGYEIGESLGEGGMGLVYRARQVALNRQVALKMIRGDPSKMLSRFQIEAEAVAQLQHPNIVQIYEIGTKDGRPYLGLEFVDGGSLEEKLAGRPQPAREAAELVRTLALAIDYAHKRGIVHRDLKPSNILLTAAGVPKITDFGVAKRLEGHDRETRDGDVIGTPCYMAPEQASGSGERVGPATDVYSLGVILYEALTGRAPIQAPTAIETLILVSTQEPVPPRKLQPRVPVDLDRITLKCLEKEPERRYPSALALAEDLGRFLNGESILARPVPPAERAWRWARRHPALAAVASTAVIALVAAAVAGWQYSVVLRWYNSQLRLAAELAQGSAKRAEAAKREAQDNARAEAEQRRQAEKSLYFSRIALAESEWRNNNVAGAELLLEKCLPGPGQPDDLRGWEWRYLKRLLHADLLTLRGCRDWVHAVAYSPDGRRVVAAAGIPYNLPGTDPYRTPGDLLVWDSSMGRAIARLEGHAGAVWSVAYSPDGRRIASASADGEVRVWDAATFATIARLAGAAASNFALRFSPDGRTLAVADSHSLRLWEPETGRVRFESKKYQGACVMAYRPDGAHLSVGSEADWFDLLDANTGDVIRKFQSDDGLIRCLDFGPDLRSLAAANQSGTITVWDATAGQVLRKLQGHEGEVTSVAVGQGGRLLASAAADQTVRLWDLNTGSALLTFRGHTFGVRSVAFQPDGTRIASAGQDSTVKVWDVDRDPRCLVFPRDGHGEWLGSLAFSADRRRMFVYRHYDGRLQSWDLGTGKLIDERPIGLNDKFKCPRGDTAFSTGGRLLAGPRRDDETSVAIWDVAGNREVRTLRGHHAPVLCVAFSHDGGRLASASRGVSGAGATQEITIWDVESGKALLTWYPDSRNAVNRLAFSSKGDQLASAGDDGTARVWDATNGRERLGLLGHRGAVFDVAFSPDDRRLASAGHDGTVRVWELAEGRQVLTLRGHNHPLTSIAYSPDGRRLVSAGYEGAAKLWDATTGQDILTLRGAAPQRPGDYYFNARVAIGPDGNQIASSTWDGSINIWDASAPPSESPGMEKARTDQ